jgi:glycogen debranching enzyme
MMNQPKPIDLRHLDRSQLPVPVADEHPEWIRIHDLAWRLAHQHIRFRKGLASPFYMDEGCMPDRVWQWDTCFMALYTAYANAIFPGIESLDNFYGWQRKDGFIGMTYFLRNGKLAYGERCNPPLYAWVEWEYFQITGDDSRFKRVLPHLVRYFDWLKANRRRGEIHRPHREKSPDRETRRGGLYWETCAGAAGCDNSPRATHLSWTGGEIAWVDFTSQQALAARCIARIADHVGNKKLAKRFEGEHRLIARLVNHWMWCPKSAFYHDIFLDGNWLSVKTTASFWTLLAGIPNARQVASLTGHLLDPKEFWRDHPVPTLSADDPNYDPTGKYWLGGVWAPVNTAIVKGLTQYGINHLAHRIARRHLDCMAEVERTTRPHTLWECYAPDLPRPGTMKNGKSRCRPHFVGWTALGATTLFYENILGIRPNAPERRITWDMRLTERHGFARYPFLGHWISLIAEKRKTHSSRPRIAVQSPVGFDLVVLVDDRTMRIRVKDGRTQRVLA